MYNYVYLHIVEDVNNMYKNWVTNKESNEENLVKKPEMKDDKWK